MTSSAVKVADRDIVLERVVVAKGLRIITLLNIIQKQVPELQREIAVFRSEYRKANVIELDPVQAKLEYPARPVLGDDGEPLFTAAGELLMRPSPIEQMTEADWQRSGGVVRFYQSPSFPEVLASVFPSVFEKAEEPLMRLLALVCMKNDDVVKHVQAGTWQEECDRFRDEVLHNAYLDEIMHLAVAAAELIEGQVLETAKGLGDKVGNLLRLIGIERTSDEDQSSEVSETSNQSAGTSSTPSSSDTPSDTDGPQEPSPDSPGTPTSSSSTQPVVSAA